MNDRIGHFALACTLFFTILNLPLNAQIIYPATRQTVTQPIAWSSYSANLTDAKGTTLFLDAHFRYAGSDQSGIGIEPMQVLLRTHVEIKVKGKLTFAPVGFAYIHNYKYGEQPATFVNHEKRLYQQLAFSHGWGKTQVGHRLRTEERFIENHDANGTNTGFSNRQFRIRYRFIATRPIGKDKIEPKTFFTQAFYEGFYSKGKEVYFKDIDQNRFFVGIGYQPIKGLNLSIGPYHQMLIKANGGKQENNIGVMVMAVHNIDVSGKKD